MRQQQTTPAASVEEAIKDIRCTTRRLWSAEDKVRIVLEGLRREGSISELYRREGIAASQYYGWSKEFLEGGKVTVFQFIEGFCNPSRRHSALGYLSPIEYERTPHERTGSAQAVNRPPKRFNSRGRH